VDLHFGTPKSIPPQYQRLQNIPIPTLKARLKILYNFSDLLFGAWNLLPLATAVVRIN